MPRIEVASGDVYGDWTVIKETEPRRRPGNNKPLRMIVCRCICGEESIVQMAHLRSGASTGCGCTKAKEASARLRKHGEAGNTLTREYRIWRSMISRCYFPSATGYAKYGAAGITVCDRWRHSFENFITDMGRPGPGQSIDRFPDRAGNYEPGNVRWASAKEQGNNTARNVYVTYQGQEMTLKQLSELTGVKYDLLHDRFKYKGMSAEDAVEAVRHL